MIITITGKPCSGKGVVTQYLIEKYGFEKFSAGEIFRKIATERGIDILELNRLNDTSIDRMVDEEITRVGERDLYKNVVFDSRTAWHFIPKAFKVFLDIDSEEQAKRLIGSGRTTEKVELSLEDAKKSMEERWNLENNRYREIYGFDNRDFSQYDIVVDTTGKTIPEIGEQIYQEYLKYIENK